MSRPLKITTTGGISALGGLSSTQVNNYFGCSVGIGVNRPVTPLHVCFAGSCGPRFESTSGSSYIYLKSSSTTNNSILYFADASSLFSGAVIYNHQYDYMALRTNGGEKVRIRSSGEVGIGNDEAEQKLTVSGNVSACGGLSAHSHANQANYFSGNVGIGTNRPGYALTIDNGDLLVCMDNGGYFQADESADAIKHSDNVKAMFGTGNDLQIYHCSSGENSYIDNSTGDLFIRNNSNDSVVIGHNANKGLMYVPDGRVELRFNDAKKFETTNSGVCVTGGLSACNTRNGIVSAGRDLNTIFCTVGNDCEGTVTSITAGDGLDGGTITSSGTIAVNSTVVRTTGSQTIAGDKTFTGNTTMTGDLSVRGSVTCIDTKICTTSAIEVRNSGTGPAILANQTGAQPVVDFQDDGTSAFYIKDGGNVGIGTTNPGAALQVQDGQVRAGHTLTCGYSFHDMPTWGYTASTSPTRLAMVTDGVERMSLLHNGSFVGIGETNPGEALTVAGNISACGGLSATKMNSYFACNVGIGTTSPDRKVVIDAGSGYPLKVNSTQDYMIGLSRSGTEEWWLKSYSNGDFAIHENGAGDQLHIDAGGNVGIGTSAPGQKLTVSGNISALGHICTTCCNVQGKLVRGTSCVVATKIDSQYVSNVGETNITSGCHGCVQIGTSKAYGIAISASPTRGCTAAVGIGTDPTTATLHVSGAGYSGGVTKICVSQADDGAGHAGGNAVLQSSGWGEAYACVGNHYIGAVGGGLRVSSTTFTDFTKSTSSKMRLDTNGCLGIATTTPNERLTVKGNISACGTVQACSVSANSTNGGFVSAGRDLADIFTGGCCSGTIDGSGTTCHVPYFSDANTIASSCAYFNSATLTNRGAISGSVFCTDGFLYAQCGRFSSDVCIGGDALIFPNDTYTAYICSADQLVIDVDYNANDTNRALMVCTGGKQRARIINHGLSSSGGLSATGSYGATNYFAGNVGIGTNAPDYTLDVAGNIGVDQYIYHNGDADTYINFTDDDINIQAGGVNFIDLTQDTVSEITFNEEGANVDFRVEGDTETNLLFTDASTDRVGIGTNNPTYTLDVAGNIGMGEYLYHNGDGDTYLRYDTNLVNLVAGGKSALKYDASSSKIVLNNTNADVDVHIMADDGNEILATDAANNRVGINTTTPNEELTVSGNISASGSLAVSTCIDTRIQNAENSTTQLYFNANNGNSANTSNDLGPGITWKPRYSGYSKRSAGILQIGEGNYFKSGLGFFTNNTSDASTDWSERMRLSMDGNLGIGEDEPGERLSVSGNISACGGLSATQMNSYFAGNVGIGTNRPPQELSVKGEITVLNSSGIQVATMQRSSDHGQFLLQQSGGVTRVCLNSNGDSYFNGGDVGIGTTTPNEKLTVQGKISASSCLLLPDAGQIRIGNGEDFRIYHNGNNNIESHNGDIIFYNYDHGEDIIFCAENTSGTAAEYIRIDSSASNTCVKQNFRFADNVKAGFSSAEDMSICHTGSQGFIDNATGTLTICSADDFVVDAESDINLDANGADIRFKDDGTIIGAFQNSSSNFVIKSGQDNKDIIFCGVDDSSDIAALTLDMSNAGKACFNSTACFGGTVCIQTGAPSICLIDSTDDDDHSIRFVNNSGTVDYEIRTTDPTSGGGGDGFYIGSCQSDGEVVIFTNDTHALTLAANQRATFADEVCMGNSKLVLNGTAVNSTATELNLLDGCTSAAGIDCTGTTTASNSQTFTNKGGNISQWTNDCGYTTCTGTTTNSNSQTFTNKGGNISQWTNDCGYTTCAGDITGVTAGVGLCGGGTSGSVTLTLDMSELTDMTATMTCDDEFIVLDSNSDRRKRAGEISNAIFDNGAGYTTCTGTTTNSNSQTFTNKSGNISQWTNDCGYTTCTGTTTNSNTQTFTNKSGCISQWTNDCGYTTCTGTSTITCVDATCGLCGGGSSGTVTVCHEDTSSQSSCNCSNGIVIQDVTLDTYGHVTGLGACNLDNRYYEHACICSFFNRGYAACAESAADCAIGWYTIATNTGDRAIAKFGLRDTDSSRHQSVIFYASHNYGTDTSNVVTVLHNSSYSTTPFRYIRIKDDGTYDGAALQVYIDNANNTIQAYILGDNFQSSGWVLKDWIPDADDPGGVTDWASFTEKTKVDLDLITQGGIATTGPIYAEGQLAQCKVLTTCGTTSLRQNDDVKALFGDDDDLQIYHSGSHGFIDNNKGTLCIRNNVDGDDGGDIKLMPHDNENGIIIYDDAGVSLYYNNSEKLETTSAGACTTGTHCATTCLRSPTVCGTTCVYGNQGLFCGAAIGGVSVSSCYALCVGSCGSCSGQGSIHTTGGVCVGGALSKASGCFNIKHPLPALSASKCLSHSFVEAPQADNIYSGVVELTAGKATVNIDSQHGMTDGTLTALNRCFRTFTTNETNWDPVRGSVTGNTLTVESCVADSTATVSWMVIGERHDLHMLQNPYTDSEGRIRVEYDKPEEDDD